MEHNGRATNSIFLVRVGVAALNTRDPSTIILTLNTICKLVRTVRGQDGSYLFGTALLPYYKTILPLINGFKNRTSECFGDFQHPLISQMCFRRVVD